MPWWVAPVAFYLVAFLFFRWIGGLGAAAETFREWGRVSSAVTPPRGSSS
jgi:hypothetical protein